MANQLRDWLGDFLERELEKAVEWKRGQINAATHSIKREPNSKDDTADIGNISSLDHKYLDNGSVLRINDVRRTPGDRNKIQITGFESYEPPFKAVLSDGYTSLHAVLDDTVVQEFTSRYKRRITEGTRGGIFSLRRFDVTVSPRGNPDLHVRIHIQKLFYSEGTAGTGDVGHPKKFRSRTRAGRLLNKLVQLEQGDFEDMPPPAPALVPAPVPANPGATTPIIVDDKNNITLSPSNSSQSFLKTQASLYTPRKRLADSDPDVQVQSGINLSGPVSASRKAPRPPNHARELLALLTAKITTVKADSPPPNRATVSLATAKLAASYEQERSSQRIISLSPELPSAHTGVEATNDGNDGLPSQPPEPPSAHTDVEIINNGHAVLLSQLLPSHLEHELDTPQVDLPSMSVNQTTRVERDLVKGEGAIVPRHRKPDRKYLQYARRRIPRDQRALLERKESWLIGAQFPQPYLPISVLERLSSKNPQTLPIQLSTENENQTHQTPPSGDNHEPANAELPASSDELISWASSPARSPSRVGPHAMNLRTNDELPPDSSAEGLPQHMMQRYPPSSPPASDISSSEQSTDLDQESDASGLEETVPRPLVHKSDHPPHVHRQASCKDASLGTSETCIPDHDQDSRQSNQDAMSDQVHTGSTIGPRVSSLSQGVEIRQISSSPSVQVQRTPLNTASSSARATASVPLVSGCLLDKTITVMQPRDFEPRNEDVVSSRVDDSAHKVENHHKRQASPGTAQSKKPKKSAKYAVDWSEDELSPGEEASKIKRRKSERFREIRKERNSIDVASNNDPTMPAAVLTMPLTAVSTAPAARASPPDLAMDTKPRLMSESRRGSTDTPIPSIETTPHDPLPTPRAMTPHECGIGRESGLRKSTTRAGQVASASVGNASVERRVMKIPPIPDTRTPFNDFVRNYSMLKSVRRAGGGDAVRDTVDYIDVLGWKL